MKGCDPKRITPRKCAWCEKPYFSKDKRTRVCSPKCSGHLVAKELGHGKDFGCLKCHALCRITTVMSADLTNRTKGQISRWRKRHGLTVVSIAREQQLKSYEDAQTRNAWRLYWENEWKGVRKFDEINHWACHPIAARVVSLASYYRNHEANKRRMAIRSKKIYQMTKHTAEVKMRLAVRNAISRICRKSGIRKHARTLRYLGCTMQEARTHIEAQFKPGMTWDNHGTLWEIDHIRPLAAFDLTDDCQRLEANNIMNLQPLWKWQNRAKAARLDWAA
jgi:hypothetical protein